ncbi:GPP34 family phosphoprotein [Nocardioides panzhihuensis]|uniref:Putative membrane protein YgcG n=1 Tax=Nocardioides panzhihuensis TaxID=860243 RepID=A0A7Z0DHS1_9ACTN|nr:putative membrane protein YgcG [Nocardioides panzhihuensis]
MLIAEDLVLLTLEDITGQPVRGLGDMSKRNILLGGALLAELALAGVIEVRKQSFWQSSKVHQVAIGAPVDRRLQQAFSIIGERPMTPRALVSRIGSQKFDHLAGVLVGRGLLRREQRRVFLTTKTFWPAVDPRSKMPVRQQVASVLLHDAHPDHRTGTLIALLSAVDQAHRLFVSPSVPPRQVKQRAKQIARADWAAGAVRDAIVATHRGVESGFSGGGFSDGGFGGGDGGGGGGGD